LAAPDAAKLEQDWRTASSVMDGRTLVADLTFVTGWDQAGRELLKRWHGNGAQLVAKSAAGRTLVEDITGRPYLASSRVEATYEPFYARAAKAAAMIAILLVPTRAVASGVDADPTLAGLAFARYVAQLDRGASTSHAVSVEVEASLPKLAKHGRLEAVRHSGSFGASEYEVLHIEGDSTVKQQVLARYLSAEMEASSVAISPSNYKFRYVASISDGRTTRYAFQITPKKKRVGLFQGQIWIDAATGLAVHQEGRLVKTPSIFVRQFDLATDTNVKDGTRVTHLDIETRLVGRAELTITERPIEQAFALSKGGRP